METILFTVIGYAFMIAALLFFIVFFVACIEEIFGRDKSSGKLPREIRKGLRGW